MQLPAINLRDLASVERQHNRLIQLAFPQDDAPYPILLPNRFEGVEFLSRDFQHTLEILSDNASLDPAKFVGKQVTVSLRRNDGSYRFFNGYIFRFRHVRTDGGYAFYEAEVGPWLRYLTFRQNNRLFSDQNLQDQSATIFRDYGTWPSWTWQVHEDDPRMTMACQFGETDHNYVHRRWEYQGIVYWYEHTNKSHQLVLSDPTQSASPIDGRTPEIRFQLETAPDEADGIQSWSPARITTSTHAALSGFDFKMPTPTHVQTGLTQPQSTQPQLEWSEYAGAYGYQSMDHGYQLVNRRMEEIAATIQTVEARSNNRFVMPGRWFRLTDHHGSALSRNSSDDEYLILSVHHFAMNNYLQGADSPAEYRNTFTCIRRTTPWRPGRSFNSVDTQILAPQTATVVGPSGGSIHTDEYGRVLIQFHWDREGKYTTWVRVASGWAGGSQGVAALPRVGSEIIVQWLDGCPDHPLVTGRVMNAHNLPSWQLPDQNALMGIRSRELNGADGNAAAGRSNHLIFDDTANAIQAQLRSDHASSQLSLGKITRIEDWQGRKDARGEGFELSTEEVGAIRSGKGMLISTEVRPKAKGHISDVSEPVARLTKAQTLHAQSAKLAQHYEAQESGSDQSGVADMLKSQVDGIQGTGAGGSDGNFPELDEAHLLLAGAAGVAITTPATAHVTSGQHVAITAGDTLSVATGKSFLASVSDKFSLFVHKMGMKLIAAAGKVQIHAENDELELLAKKVLSLISTTDWINLTAKQGIRLTAGNSKFEVSQAGIIGYTPGANTLHAASHDTVGPQSVPAKFPGSDLCAPVASGAAQTGQASVALS